MAKQTARPNSWAPTAVRAALIVGGLTAFAAIGGPWVHDVVQMASRTTAAEARLAIAQRELAEAVSRRAADQETIEILTRLSGYWTAFGEDLRIFWRLDLAADAGKTVSLPGTNVTLRTGRDEQDALVLDVLAPDIDRGIDPLAVVGRIDGVTGGVMELRPATVRLPLWKHNLSIICSRGSDFVIVIEDDSQEHPRAVVALLPGSLRKDGFALGSACPRHSALSALDRQTGTH